MLNQTMEIEFSISCPPRPLISSYQTPPDNILRLTVGLIHRSSKKMPSMLRHNFLLDGILIYNFFQDDSWRLMVESLRMPQSMIERTIANLEPLTIENGSPEDFLKCFPSRVILLWDSQLSRFFFSPSWQWFCWP